MPGGPRRAPRGGCTDVNDPADPNDDETHCEGEGEALADAEAALDHATRWGEMCGDACCAACAEAEAECKYESCLGIENNDGTEQCGADPNPDGDQDGMGDCTEILEACHDACAGVGRNC